MLQSTLSTELDTQKYTDAIISYLEENRVSAVPTRLRLAVCLAAAGSTDGYISYALSSVNEDSGLTSHIFALHLVSNGYECPKLSKDALIESILHKQEGGAWSVRAGAPDADATAMTIQALAPYYAADERVRAAIDSALEYLSDAQLENGGFISYGEENPESSAQVIIALCSLGIDPLSDERFIKNERTLLDAMVEFTSDGLVSHTKGGEYNLLATSQVAMACVALERHSDGLPAFFTLERAMPDSVLPSDEPFRGTADVLTPTADGKDPVMMARIVISALIVVAVAIFVLVLAIKRILSPKRLLPALAAATILLSLVWLLDIRLPQDYYSELEPQESVVGSVRISIRLDDGIELAGKPRDILTERVVDVYADDTVYSVLVRVLRQNKIQFENDGIPGSAYISGIADIYEQDASSLSGWTYFVNGDQARLAADKCAVRNGDIIEWIYGERLPSD